MNKQKQCPYDEAVKCIMDEPCRGCEVWAEYMLKLEGFSILPKNSRPCKKTLSLANGEPITIIGLAAN
ncbi:MAG: hypothetical protein GY853_13580 [PVC group bacterium]|nr:hypothetical protein [PVC group bacterium]